MTPEQKITGNPPAAPQPVSLAACLSPFSRQMLRATVAPGRSLFEIFQAPELAAVFEAPQLFVFVNDRLIERGEWLCVHPAAGDIISVRVWPSGGGSGGRTLAMIGVTILAIAASALTYGYLSGPAWGAWAGVMAGLAGAAVSLTGTLLVNALIPIQQPKNKAAGLGFAVSGTRNVADPYGPVTRCFGLNRVYPKYAAIPYTELSGSDQYLRCLFLIGRGRYALSAHKIGETAIGDLTGVSLETYYTGAAAGNSFNLFPSDVYEEALALALTQAASWQTHSSQPDTDEISLDIAFPQGLYNINHNGNKTAVGVNFEIQYAPYGTTDWIDLNTSRDLIFSAAADGNIAIGQAALGLSSGATGTVRYAHTIYNYVYTGDDDNGRPIYAFTASCDWARVETASGTFLAGETVRFAGVYDAGVSAVRVTPTEIAAEHHQLYRYGYTIKVPRGQWTVRVRRLTADGRDDTTDTSVLSAFRSISYEAPVNLADCTLVGLRIKATGQLNGIIEQYNCLAQAIIPAHDGTAWNEVATSSPAWAYCEALKGKSNARPITDSRLDLTAIRAWDANCAAAGREFNHIVDYRTTVWALLADICAVGRASRGIVDNKFTVIEDMPQSVPVQHFSPRNSWGFRARRSFPEVPHGFKIKFKNAAAAYADDEVIVYDAGYSSANATKFEELEFRGVTSADQAWKLGRYHLACVRLRPEVFEFFADVEHLVCTRGSLIRLNHDAISVGVGAGRVKSFTTSGSNIATVTFDDVFPMASGKSYGFRWRKSDGNSGTTGVVSVAGDNYTVTLSPQVTIVSGPVVGDLCQFGEAGLESIPALITRIDPGGDLSAKLSAVIYDPAVYTADGGTIPTHTTGINVQPIDNRTPATPAIVSTSYGFKSSRLNDDGTYAIVFTTVFEAQASAFAQGGTAANDRPDVIRGFQAQYRVNDGEWVTLPLLGPEARSFEFVAADEAVYDVRVRSFSLPGLYSAWSTASDITIALTGTVPANVTGLQIDAGGAAFATTDCPIEWTAVPGGGTAGLLVKDYKVEVRSADGLTIYRTEYVTQNNFTYSFAKNVEDTGGTPIASMQFRVWARSAWGDLSASHASLTAVNAAPGNPQGLGSRNFMGGVEFYWIANSEPDFSHFLYRLRITAGGAWGSWQNNGKRTGIERTLSAAEKDSYGADAAIYFEVKAVDAFGQESGTSADDETCGSLNVKESDIDDFAVSASKIFTRIPVVQGLALTDNSPSAGFVAWSAHTIYYNGTAFAIAAGNANTKYIYWKNAASALQASDTHPASVIGWVPGADFIIAVNIAGTGQAAWNAIANQVIGSAYIENLGVLDAHIQSLSGTKILATSSIAIGSATFGNLGIQFEYNGGAPRFYAGNGAQDYIKYQDGEVFINCGGAAEAVRISGGRISIKSNNFGQDGIQLDYNAGNPRFYCGDGAGNYIKFDGANSEFSTDKVNAITIKSGGDILFEGSQTNPGLIKWNCYGTSGFQAGAGALSGYPRWAFYPNTAGEGVVYFGLTPTLSSRFLQALVVYTCSYQGNQGVVMRVFDSTAGTYYCGLDIYSGSVSGNNILSIEPGGFYLVSHKLIDFGTSAGALDDVYADDFQNVADFLHLDSRDDLAAIRSIKGSGIMDERTGFEMIDDETVPDWMLTKNKKTGDLTRDPDGKPYISLKMMTSLLMGACRQLDAKLTALERKEPL
ncbi:MAG: hypothetical protein HY895_03150 [Deltaproteobacteria bacterium]|nr:hypothetical protein [Deltaproteobacteria bacterium]